MTGGPTNYSLSDILARIIKISASLAAITVALWFAFSLYGQVVFVVDVTSDTKSVSQLFFKGDGEEYSQIMSATLIINVERQELAYKVGAGLSCTALRWDPATKGGMFIIHGAWIEYLGRRFYIDIKRPAGIDQIKSYVARPGGIVVIAKATATDPQIHFDPRIHRLIAWQLALSTLPVLIIGVVVCLLHFFRSRLEEFEQAGVRLFQNLLDDGLTLKRFGVFLAMAMAINLYSLANFTLSTDDELAALRLNPVGWVAQGRWFAYLVEKYLLPQPVLPYLPELIFNVTIAFSYMLIVRGHNLSFNWRVYLAFPIFCTFPTWPFLSGFCANLPSAGLGLLFISLAFYIFVRSNYSFTNAASARWTILSIAVQSLLIAMAFAAYQSLFLLYVAAGSGAILLRLIAPDEQPDVHVKLAFSTFIRLMLTGLLGFMLYLAINFLFQRFFATGSEYIAGFFRPDHFFNDPSRVLKLVLSEALTFYSGSARKFSDNLTAVMALSVAACACVVLKSLPQPKKLLSSLFFFSATLLAPFALTLAAGGVVPSRTFVSLPYVVWLLAIVTLTAKRASAIFICAAIVIAVTFQSIRTTSQYAAASSITLARDKVLAADIYRRMAELGFDPKQQLVIDVFGISEFNNIFPRREGLGSSFFEWNQVGNVRRIGSLLTMLGYGNVKGLGNDLRPKYTDAFKKMRPWPAVGSVAKVDGVFLIKLGDTPDKMHE
ncbi:hypothetical protein Deba_0359 [Desulfarculus baarsii DSM 2075]|uniref:Uncharacterized protein n=1 Tax=Desulfarculus baarsii (strain ATCC 33931 / DSM 2075 / LMG 7858 / VKM B-1802 / 2st14) TaxID=644282 RepID=E1QDU8_DESB2|nr:hypothetical protein Deba_0359 [Desulfarculus baarsii DSM 2075]